MVPEHAEREDIHQRIAIVALFENAFAANGRYAETVAVMRDAGDHALQNAPPDFGMLFNQRELRLRELPGFLEYDVGDHDLADVMK